MPTDTIPMEGWEYICYTDNPAKPAPYPWKTISLASLRQLEPFFVDEFKDLYLSQLLICRPNAVFNIGMLTVYHDPNISLDHDTLSKLVDKLDETDMLFKEHDHITSFSDELNYIDQETSERYIKELTRTGYNFGDHVSIDTRIVIRKLNIETLIFGEEWMINYMKFPNKIKNSRIPLSVTIQKLDSKNLKLIRNNLKLINFEK